MKTYNRIFITGDKHRDFRHMSSELSRLNACNTDLVILLGDVGLNYDNGPFDLLGKAELARIGCDFLCVHGNHERRPDSVDIVWSYSSVPWNGGTVFQESDFPTLLFAKDGEFYTINQKSVLAIGGAYSVNKKYLLAMKRPWFYDEQLFKNEKEEVLQKITEHGNQADIILSHTCPHDHMPRESFLNGIDQLNIDCSMELFLQKISSTIRYQAWYCGHYHVEKDNDRVHFLFQTVKTIFENGAWNL